MGANNTPRGSKRPYDVIVIGELNVDIILRGDVAPRFGQAEKLVDDLELCAGSSAAIFAASASKMGLRVLYISVVGDDVLGHYMLAALRGAGVDASRVRVDATLKTGATVVLAKADDRAMLTYLGSISAVSARDLPADWASLARHFHVASPFLLSALRPDLPRLMAEAKSAGMTVSLDTNWDPDETWSLEGFFEFLDLFMPNDAELRAISGCDNLEEALATMATRVPLVVVKLGAEGALAVRGQERVHAPAYPVKVISTTGAGDTFDGAFLAAWLRGKSLQRCLELGNAAGALTTTQVGGFNGQPTWEEAERFIALHRPT
ncbi:MAG: sugar kinase [Chloroflexi bacterium]|nr:sugar kinase [Chloroflexota bacterium]